MTFQSGERSSSEIGKAVFFPTVLEALLNEKEIRQHVLHQASNICSLDYLNSPATPATSICGAISKDGLPQFCQRHSKDEATSSFSELDSTPTKCKTLWFAGMSERFFEKTEDVLTGIQKANLSNSPFVGSYKNYYMLAVESLAISKERQRLQGNISEIDVEVLQPILLLHEFDRGNISTVEASFLAKFARSRGVIVLSIDQLSIQGAVDEIFRFPKTSPLRTGPFLRMEIPKIIENYNLWDIPGVCHDGYVLYTDSDVFFPNPISHEDIRQLKSLMNSTTVVSNGIPSVKPRSPAIVMYGREFAKYPQLWNTGVMMIDVPKFSAEMPAILNYGLLVAREKGNATVPFPACDQGWMNEYFSKQENQGRHLRTLLPINFNWKSYWGLTPSAWSDLKIIHFHGPKPGRLLEEIAMCDFSSGRGHHAWSAYELLVREGICCDQGTTATSLLRSIESLATYLPFLKL